MCWCVKLHPKKKKYQNARKGKEREKENIASHADFSLFINFKPAAANMGLVCQLEATPPNANATQGGRVPRARCRHVKTVALATAIARPISTRLAAYAMSLYFSLPTSRSHPPMPRLWVGQVLLVRRLFLPTCVAQPIALQMAAYVTIILNWTSRAR